MTFWDYVNYRWVYFLFKGISVLNLEGDTMGHCSSLQGLGFRFWGSFWKTIKACCKFELKLFYRSKFFPWELSNFFSFSHVFNFSYTSGVYWVSLSPSLLCCYYWSFLNNVKLSNKKICQTYLETDFLTGFLSSTRLNSAIAPRFNIICNL